MSGSDDGHNSHNFAITLSRPSAPLTVPDGDNKDEKNLISLTFFTEAQSHV